MALLPVLKPGIAGANLAFTAADVAGDTFVNDGNVVLLMRKSGVGDLTVTLATPATPKGLVIAPLVIVAGASSLTVLGPFPPAVFNNASGQVSMTYSGVTNLTFGVIGV